MINLLEYFDDNVKDTYYERYKFALKRSGQYYEDDYYYKESNILDYSVYDEIEMEEKFRSICQPSNYYSDYEETWFFLISFYFFKNKIYIRQFPKIFERPKGLAQFACDEIRKYAFNNGYTNGDMTKVEWSVRRKIIDELIFEKNIQGVIPSDKTIELINMIESNSTSWQSMQLDAKLSALNNSIEYCLKNNGKFVSISNINHISDFIKCKEFRTITHCMRHGSKEALEERKKFSDSEKRFLVDYGVSLIHLIRRNMES